MPGMCARSSGAAGSLHDSTASKYHKSTMMRREPRTRSQVWTTAEAPVAASVPRQPAVVASCIAHACDMSVVVGGSTAGTLTGWRGTYGRLL